MKTEPSTSSTTPPVLPKRGEPEINPPPFVRGNLAWGVHWPWHKALAVANRHYHSHLFASIHGLSVSIWYWSVDHATHNAKLCSSSNDLCQSSHHARYWVCRNYSYHFSNHGQFLYSYIERQPPVSSCAPGIFNVFKTAKFCFSSIDPCQQSHHAWYWFCRDNNYGIPTLDSFFLFLCRETAPSEQLCSWRT